MSLWLLWLVGGLGAMGGAAALVLVVTQAALPVAAVRAQSAEPAAPDDASTAQDAQLDQAMRAYERGTDNYNHAQYEAALADFKEAASLYASPDFQYNIGLCYEKLGKLDEAIRAFATYLRAKPDAPDRANVEDRIHDLEERIEQQKRDAEAAEAARLEAERSKAPPPVEPKDDVPQEPKDEGKGLVIAGAALIGLGGAVALGGGIGFGVAAGQRSKAVDDVQSGGNPDGLTFAETQTLEDQGKRLEAIQIGMAAGGAVVAVTGSVLLALGLRKRQAVRASAWLGPSTAGLALTGRF